MDSTQQRLRRIVQRTGEVVEQATGTGSTAPATVGAIMSTVTLCVRDDVTVAAMTALLLEHGYSAVPVVAATGRALGVVSKTDLLGHVAGGGGPDATADQIMMPMVFAVEEDAPIGEAAALMAGERVHRLPVVDGKGTVVGILSALDLVRWLGQLAGYHLKL
jgi:CBS domain-containing protein